MPATTAGDDLRIEIDAGVAWLTLNRPQAGNSLTPDQRDEIIAFLGAASGDLSIRAIVLTAAGDRHFCTGADLRMSRPAPPQPPGAPEQPVSSMARMIATGAQRLVTSVLDCEKPVIAAVNGTAAGIGSHLALACDLVIAADTARFIEVFIRSALLPDGGGAYLLTRLLGPHKTKELMFFGDEVPAAEAARIGLVNRVVPAAELASAAGEWARRLAGAPTVTLGLTKALVNRSLDVDRSVALREEAVSVELNMSSQDANAGLTAFRTRTAATYQGW